MVRSIGQIFAITWVAAPRLRTIVFNATQGSQSLALGLTTSAPMNRGSLSYYVPTEIHYNVTQGSQSLALGLTLVAASRLRTIVFNVTQGSQSLALGLTLVAASRLRTIVFNATPRLAKPRLGLSYSRCFAAPDNYFQRNPRLAKPRLGLIYVRPDESGLVGESQNCRADPSLSCLRTNFQFAIFNLQCLITPHVRF